MPSSERRLPEDLSKDRQNFAEFVHKIEQEVTDNLFKPFEPKLKSSLDFLHNVEFSHELSKAASQRFQKFAEEYEPPKRNLALLIT